MEESYSPVGGLRDVMVAFNGEDHAKTYAVDKVDYERFKAALLDDSKAWAEIKQYGMRRTVFINKENVKRVVM